MPAWDPKSKTFKARIRISGHPQIIKTGFRSREDAKRWELNAKHSLKTSEPLPAVKNTLTLSVLAGEYLAYCAAHGYVDGTITTKAQIVRYFIKTMGHDPDIKDFTESLIESYIDSIPNPKTANRHLREIKTICNWFVKKKILPMNPCLSIEKHRTQKYAPYVPPPEDINKVLIAANDFEYDFIQTIYHLSARRKEVMSLKWDDVDFANKTIAIWTRKRYGGQLERDLMKMNNVLIGILENRFQSKTCEWIFHRDGVPLRRSWIEKMLKNLCKKAGVKYFGFHAIRHHVSALMAASRKLSIVDIQRQLRHQSATTTDHYLKGLIVESNAAEVIEEMQTGKQESNIMPIRQKK